MKKIFLAATAFFSVSLVHAQNETPAQQPEEMQTLFNGSGPLGWWVSPDFAVTSIDGRNAWLGGLSGGVIINHNFSIGLGGYGIMNSNNLNFSGVLDTADVYLYGGYGGVKFEYRMAPLKKVHLAFPVLIGGGSVAYSTWNWKNAGAWEDDNWDENVYVWDSFFVIEPGVVVGLNLLKWMRFDAGVSYRYAPGVDLPKTNSNLMNGVNGTFSLKFGKF